MATQLLETQQVPGVKEAMNAAKDAADKATEAEAVAEVAKVAAAKAADSAADSAISAEHAEHMATSAVESANKAIEAAEAATEATTAATEQLQESVAKIDGLEQRVDEAEGQVVEFREELDAMQSASDVVDIVDTKAQLDAYDTSKVHANDVIKVLQDETHDGAITYYRFKDTARSADQWEYIGETGPYYTKSEADTKFATKDELGGGGSNLSSYENVFSNSSGRLISWDNTRTFPAGLYRFSIKFYGTDGMDYIATGNEVATFSIYGNHGSAGTNYNVYMTFTEKLTAPYWQKVMFIEDVWATQADLGSQTSGATWTIKIDKIG